MTFAEHLIVYFKIIASKDIDERLSFIFKINILYLRSLRIKYSQIRQIYKLFLVYDICIVFGNVLT